MNSIGLTGGMGCGKTTAAEILRSKGAEIIDADLLAREVVVKGKPAYIRIVERFGSEILFEDESIDRKKLASIVFNNRLSLNFLNQITHREIALLRNQRIHEIYQKNPDSLVINVVPLLFETHMQALFQKVILVCLDKQEQIKRLTQNRGFSQEEINARLRNQMSQDEKKALADFLLDNNGSQKQTEANLQPILNRIQSLPQIKI